MEARLETLEFLEKLQPDTDIISRYDGGVISVSASWLTTRCSYFQQSINAERTKQGSGEARLVVYIDDCTVDILQIVIDYLTYGILPRFSALKMGKIVDLFILVSRFSITKLVNFTNAYLQMHARNSRAWDVCKATEGNSTLSIIELHQQARSTIIQQLVKTCSVLKCCRCKNTRGLRLGCTHCGTVKPIASGVYEIAICSTCDRLYYQEHNMSIAVNVWKDFDKICHGREGITVSGGNIDVMLQCDDSLLASIAREMQALTVKIVKVY